MNTIEQLFSQWEIEKADESTRKLARFMFFMGAHAVLENVHEGMKTDDGGKMFSEGYRTMVEEVEKELLPHLKGEPGESIQ